MTSDQKIPKKYWPEELHTSGVLLIRWWWHLPSRCSKMLYWYAGTWRPATGVVMPSWRPECDGVLNSKEFGTFICCDIDLFIQRILLFTWHTSQILDRRQETACFTQDFELAASQVEREMVRLEQVHTSVCHQTSPQIRVHQEKQALETAFFGSFGVTSFLECKAVKPVMCQQLTEARDIEQQLQSTGS